jgi:hypothetical protein
MHLGAFGCAPILPSLVVDLRVLEFSTNLFLQVSPNNTAMSITLERVLATMGFQLEHQVRLTIPPVFPADNVRQHSLRRRFGNCLMWYTHLRNLLKEKYSGIIDSVRASLLPPEEAQPPPPASPPRETPPAASRPPRGRQAERSGARAGSSSGTPTPASPKSRRARVCTPSPSPSPSPARRRARSPSPSRTPEPLPGRRKRNREPSPDPPQVPFPEPPPRTRPSEYLRRRCPACFGNLEHDPIQV